MILSCGSTNNSLIHYPYRVDDHLIFKIVPTTYIWSIPSTKKNLEYIYFFYIASLLVFSSSKNERQVNCNFSFVTKVLELSELFNFINFFLLNVPIRELCMIFYRFLSILEMISENETVRVALFDYGTYLPFPL